MSFPTRRSVRPILPVWALALFFAGCGPKFANSIAGRLAIKFISLATLCSLANIFFCSAMIGHNLLNLGTRHYSERAGKGRGKILIFGPKIEHFLTAISSNF